MSVPRVLAGPILRRVTSDSVSVWVACSQNLHVEVKLYDGHGVKVSAAVGDFSTTSATEVPTSSAGGTTIFFGPQLWVAVVTAVPVVGLQPDRVYSYDLRFTSADEPFLKADLRSEGFLSSDPHEGRKQVPIGYGSDELPTFVMTHDDPEKLFVVQASCRKMHGHGHDALAHLDTIIESHRGVAEERPQQLFLTGDQIYADDVPGSVLRFLGVVDGASLGVHEKVAVDRPDGSNGELEVEITTWPPYTRQGLMTRVAGFTSGSAANHVIGFTEYAALYLAYWNLRAWSQDLVDEVSKVVADNKESVALEVATSLLDSAAIEDDPNLKGIYEEARDRGGVDFEMALTDDLTPVFVPESSSAEDRQAQQERFDDWIERTRTRLKNELKEVARFVAALPTVSRVLANVPTYMVMDDHEITDDWYLTERWNTRVLSTRLGRDVIRNGLMAYAVFQDWGNVPAEYVPIEVTGEDPDDLTPRTRLIRLVSDYCWELSLDPDRATVRSEIIPRIEALLGLGDGASEVKWHYQVRTGPTTTFVLDTRTRRGYESLNSPPALLTEEALDEQVPRVNPAGPAPFVIVVSPSPAPGLSSFEELVQPAYMAVAGLKEPGGPDPGVLQGMPAADFEAWGFNVGSLEALLERLSLHEKVIVFSGDVHYGFSSVLDYWRGNETVPVARILTFTASSLKNEETGLLHLYRSALVQKLLTGIGMPLEKVGWRDKVLSVSGPASIRNRQRLRENPAVVPVAGWRPGTTVNRPPDYRWRVDILSDDRPRTGDPVTADIRLDHPASVADGYEKVVARHQDSFVTGVHRRMVWPSHVGLLRFATEGGDLVATHDFLFVAGSRDIAAATPGPHIRHRAALVASGSAATRPELP